MECSLVSPQQLAQQINERPNGTLNVDDMKTKNDVPSFYDTPTVSWFSYLHYIFETLSNNSMCGGHPRTHSFRIQINKQKQRTAKILNFVHFCLKATRWCRQLPSRSFLSHPLLQLPLPILPATTSRYHGENKPFSVTLFFHVCHDNNSQYSFLPTHSSAAAAPSITRHSQTQLDHHAHIITSSLPPPQNLRHGLHKRARSLGLSPILFHQIPPQSQAYRHNLRPPDRHSRTKSSSHQLTSTRQPQNRYYLNAPHHPQGPSSRFLDLPQTDRLPAQWQMAWVYSRRA